MTFKRLLLLTLVVSAVLAHPLRATASQEAVIDVEKASIRQHPDTDGRVLENLKSGERIRISSTNRNGWYKAKTKDGKFGWIWQGELFTVNDSKDLHAANLDLPERSKRERGGTSEPWLFLKA